MSIEDECRRIVQSAGERVPEIDAPPILEAMAGGETMPCIVDIRPEQERAEEGAIPGAHHVPMQLLPAAAFDLEKHGVDADTPLICQCRSGRRSLTAAQVLSQSGFRCVLSLRGGIKGWRGAGGPVDSPAG